MRKTEIKKKEINLQKMRYLLKLNARFSLNGNLERVKKLILNS